MIKTLIFDFGDVFLTLNKSATQRHLDQHNIPHNDKHLSKVNTDYEKGLIPTSEFIQYYTKRFPQLTITTFKTAWNSILVDFPESRLKFLKELKSSGRFRLVLLSNTNALHIDWVKTNIPVFDEFKACFDQFYLSHDIHLRKPESEIFEFVLHQNQLNPAETLFIDDTLEHTLSAKELGIHTWHLNAGHEDVSDLFSIKSNLF